MKITRLTFDFDEELAEDLAAEIEGGGAGWIEDLFNADAKAWEEFIEENPHWFATSSRYSTLDSEEDEKVKLLKALQIASYTHTPSVSWESAHDLLKRFIERHAYSPGWGKSKGVEE